MPAPGRRDEGRRLGVSLARNASNPLEPFLSVGAQGDWSLRWVKRGKGPQEASRADVRAHGTHGRSTPSTAQVRRAMRGAFFCRFHFRGSKEYHLHERPHRQSAFCRVGRCSLELRLLASWSCPAQRDLAVRAGMGLAECKDGAPRGALFSFEGCSVCAGWLPGCAAIDALEDAVTGCVARTVVASNRANHQSLWNRRAFQSEDFPDELNLPGRIPFRQPPHLAFPDHVHCLIALNCPPRSIERSKTLAGIHSPLDPPMVLFHNII